MADVEVRTLDGTVDVYEACTFATDKDGTNNLEIYLEDGRLFAAYAEGHWERVVFRV